MSNPRAAYSLCVFRSPDEWSPLWDSASVPRQIVGKFELGSQEYTLMAFFYQDHSLQELLVDAWQELPPATQPPPSAPEDQVQKVRQRAAELGRSTKLTPREQQILELLCLGGSFEEIATQLRIRPRTVKFHQENLLRKTGSSSRIELFRKLI
jgi:DNA-binding NarL/FixJ family response regulator